MRDYYEILGVPRGSDEAALKSAFRKLAMEHHPDRNGGSEEASARFKEINEAYSVLSDPKKRAAYDQFGHAGVNGAQGGGGPGFTDINDIFSEVFGSAFGDMFGGGQRRSGPARGQDLRYDLEIDFLEAIQGCEKEITIRRPAPCSHCDGTGAASGSKVVTCTTCRGQGQVAVNRGFFSIAQPCPKCGGTGQTIQHPCKHCHGEGRAEENARIKLKIPAGVDTGARLRSSGQGEAGSRGGAAGDLYVVLSVRSHPVFARQDDDLFCEVPVSFAQLTLGSEISVPSLDGELNLKIPAGTPSDKVFRLRSQGVPSLSGRGRGDLHVRVRVEIPKHLTAAQRQALEQFSKLCDESTHPEGQSFLEKARKLFKG